MGEITLTGLNSRDISPGRGSQIGVPNRGFGTLPEEVLNRLQGLNHIDRLEFMVYSSAPVARMGVPNRGFEPLPGAGIEQGIWANSH